MGKLLSKEERQWGMACHLSAFAFFIFPFGNLIGPLAVWLLKKEDYPFVEDQGRESLNFQITVTLWLLISLLLALFIIGFILMAVVFVGGFVYVVIASVRAGDGEYYRYPYMIRIIKKE